ncbi:gamma-glutamyltransferase [Prescottella equi]
MPIERQPSGDPRVGRSFVSPKAAVASPNALATSAGVALATSAGVDVLTRGGTAVDAMVAVNAALGVVYPHMSGPGGDAFWLVHDSASGQQHVYNASGGAARAATIDRYPKAVPSRGPGAALTVPGAVDGWCRTHERFGGLSLADCLARAIEYARDGFPVSPGLARYTADHADLLGLADGCEFLLVFDDGSFSENSTFSITDWFSSTPPEVLAANFDIPEEALRGLPAGETYMYQGEIPGPLEDERRATMSPAGETPHAFTYRLDAQDPDFEGSGTVRIADSSNFEVSKTIAAALVEVEPGGIRELHWHPTNDEWQYYISGEGRMTVFAAEGHARTFDYRAGDVGYVPFAMGHYIQNTGDTPLRFLEMFRSDRFEDISLNQWMALTPRTLLEEHLRPDERLMQSLSKDKRPIVK